MASRVPAYIREHKQEIVDAWAEAVSADARLARLGRGALVDHLPEVLDGLASWVEGRADDAERAFVALADGHAVQRLGFGIELAVVNLEYMTLRRTLRGHLLRMPDASDLRDDLMRVEEGLDAAVLLAIQRYTERREFVRDRFVSILGHDLRTPLQSATMAVGALLRSPTLEDGDRKRVLVVARAVQRMTSMVGDVLDFAHGHLGGGIPATPAACDVGDLCRRAAEEVEAAHPQRSVVVHTSGDLRGFFDEGRVLQALGNLLANAVQHGDGAITLAAEEAEDGRAIVTRVANAGAPIPRERLPALFEAFSHAGDDARTSLGLGLYIVAQIARAHGGTCEVTSSEEETVFSVRWPRAPVDESPHRT